MLTDLSLFLELTLMDELGHVFRIIENHSGSSSNLFLDIQW